MNCPVDNTTLLMTERRGIEIDYCPDCRGVWLDRGELDKMIELAEPEAAGPPPAAPPPEPPRQERYERRPEPERYRRDDDTPPRGYRYDDDHRHYGKKKKKKDFLGDLFDFG